MTEEDIASEPVRGDIILKSLGNLEFMGLNVKDAIIRHIQTHGITLDDRHYYSLNDIKQKVRSIFGEDATQLLMKKVEDEIKAYVLHFSTRRRDW